MDTERLRSTSQPGARHRSLWIRRKHHRRGTSCPVDLENRYLKIITDSTGSLVDKRDYIDDAASDSSLSEYSDENWSTCVVTRTKLAAGTPIRKECAGEVDVDSVEIEQRASDDASTRSDSEAESDIETLSGSDEYQIDGAQGSKQVRPFGSRTKLEYNGSSALSDRDTPIVNEINLRCPQSITESESSCEASKASTRYVQPSHRGMLNAYHSNIDTKAALDGYAPVHRCYRLKDSLNVDFVERSRRLSFDLHNNSSFLVLESISKARRAIDIFTPDNLVVCLSSDAFGAAAVPILAAALADCSSRAPIDHDPSAFKIFLVRGGLCDENMDVIIMQQCKKYGFTISECIESELKPQSNIRATIIASSVLFGLAKRMNTHSIPLFEHWSDEVAMEVVSRSLVDLLPLTRRSSIPAVLDAATPFVAEARTAVIVVGNCLNAMMDCISSHKLFSRLLTIGAHIDCISYAGEVSDEIVASIVRGSRLDLVVVCLFEPRYYSQAVDGIAKAFGVPIVRCESHKFLLSTRYDSEQVDSLSRIPAGSSLVLGNRGTLPSIKFKNIYVLHTPARDWTTSFQHIQQSIRNLVANASSQGRSKSLKSMNRPSMIFYVSFSIAIVAIFVGIYLLYIFPHSLAHHSRELH